MTYTINGKTYEFKMTRKGIRAAEQAGMDISAMSAKPMSAVSYLWFAGLYAAQPMKFEKACELLDEYLDSQTEDTIPTLFETLSTQYSEVFGLAAE